jgi:cytochrome c oxidase assembly protein subunit 11
LVNSTVAENKNGKTVLILLLILAGMIVLVAMTPRLYRAFCEATGFGGTTQRAERAPGAVAGQIGVRFDANVHPGLPWRFEPKQNTVRISPGARTKIFYTAQNLSARAITGQAVYNVSPDTVGKYFKKIQCFCFSEQTLQPGQKVDMPVIFFVDPAIKKDPDTKDIDEITLSYTFYPVETVPTAR